jgi:hypothetical protein
MKKYLFILLATLSIACSKDKTKIVPERIYVPRGESPCEDKLKELTKALNDRIPELQTIGVPYVERITDGDAELAYYIEQCPTPHADTLISNYYRMTVGYTTNMIDQYWYGFWVRADLANIILFDFESETRMPLEEARASQQWTNVWNMRKKAN